jgi:hypothetical protein
VVDVARCEKMVVIDTDGSAELVFPEFDKPVSLVLAPA